MLALEDTALAALDVLIQAPAALITDIDGTISPIVASPEQAAVSGRARAALASLARDLALVGVVTARDEATARGMVGLAGLSYVGNYALAGEAWAAVTETGLDRAKAKARPLIDRFPGSTFEDKGVSFTLHYRNCDDPFAVREQLLALLTPLAEEEGARILEGKRVIELVPRSLPDKGTAVARLLEARSLRGAVYLGDDFSDIAVFREIARRRWADGLPGLGVAVVDKETDETVWRAADARLEGVTEVETFLEGLAAAMTKEGV
jgi:trehalose 6-phosphate phosphatase